MRRLASLATALGLSAAACAVDLPAAAPLCDSVEVLVLMAQAVPQAEEIPCLTELPLGWSVDQFEPESGAVHFTVSYAVAGGQVFDARFASSCQETDQQGTTRPVDVAPGETADQLRHEGDLLEGDHHRGLAGACLSARVELDAEDGRRLLEEFDDLLTTVGREELSERMAEITGRRVDLPRASD